MLYVTSSSHCSYGIPLTILYRAKLHNDVVELCVYMHPVAQNTEKTRKVDATGDSDRRRKCHDCATIRHSVKVKGKHRRHQKNLMYCAPIA